MWSSGTGFAGPGGYLLSIFVLSQLDGDSRVFVAECLVALFAVTYSWILPRPRPTPEARAIILSASSGRAQSHTQHDLRQSVLDHVLGSAETPLAAGAAGGASGMVPLASSAHNFPPDLPATTYFPEGVPRDSGGGLLPDVSPLMSNISEDHRTELGRASAAEQRASEQRASDKMDREHCGVTLESINQSMRDKDVMARNGADDDREPSASSMSSLTMSLWSSWNSASGRKRDIRRLADLGSAHGSHSSQFDRSVPFNPTTPRERLAAFASLWPFLAPLFLVYWAEYVLQAGAWTAFSLKLGEEASGHQRNVAYKYMNLFYQVGQPG